MAFKRLSHAQYATGWVLCAVGRAFFECVDYTQAAIAFEWARKVDPHRLEVHSCSIAWDIPMSVQVEQTRTLSWPACSKPPCQLPHVICA